MKVLLRARRRAGGRGRQAMRRVLRVASGRPPARGSGRQPVSRLAPCLVALVFLGACASPSKLSNQLAHHLESGDYAAGIELLEVHKERSFGGKNAFLYHLERGMLLHYDGRYADSSQSFERAKRIAEDLYTRSVSAEAATFMVNDNARPYYGENFERALIHMFSALNYQALGNMDAALVEIRQLNFFLRQLGVEGHQRNTYSDDAFGHYLAAMFFEADGQLDEALIAYKKALDAYHVQRDAYGVKTPSRLLPQATAVAARLGRSELRQLHRRYGVAKPRVIPKDFGEVVVLHYNGRAPEKIDVFIDVAFGEGWGYVNRFEVDRQSRQQIAEASVIATSIATTESFRVAFPEYRDVPHAIAYMEVQAGRSGEVVRAELVEGVGAIAERDLKDRIARIRAKAIARAAIKYALNKGVEEAVRDTDDEYADLFAAVVQVGGSILRNATEVADKRCWLTVPDEIWMAVLALPAGEHSLPLTYRDSRGAPIAAGGIQKVSVKPGRRTFAIVRTTQ
jgi:tetratricopeptide (TPR) repeat protein